MLKLCKREKIIVYILLVIYSSIILIPFFMTIMNSFKSMREIFLLPFSLPSHPSFRNFIDAWHQANMGNAYLNSALIAFTSVIGTTFISSLFAYAISRYRFPFRRQLYMYSMLGLAFPARLAIIPVFLMMKSLGLIDTRLGLIIIYISVGIPFSVFLLKNFIDGVPLEIEEAARIDGASAWMIFWRIVLPLIRPALAIVAIVRFVGVWNDFFFPLIFINTRSKATITLAVSIFFGEYSNTWNLLFASLTLAIIPILILFLIFSKQFISGMTKGAIK